MPRIGGFPRFCKRFFRGARKLIGRCHFAHSWRVVVAIAGMNGRRRLVRIEKLCKGRRTRQAIAHFLTQAQWDAPFVVLRIFVPVLRGVVTWGGMSVVPTGRVPCVVGTHCRQ